jgi:hypothetical protein
MKTFRWTVPEPPLSAVELRAHKAARKNKGIPEPPEMIDELGVIPMNWRERWALHRLRQNRSRWSFIWILFNPIFFTLLWYGREDAEYLIWVIWFFTAFLLDDLLRGSAITAILKRQNNKANKSEMATPRNPSDQIGS